jgi:NADH:ubiquinone oxidoreductase subunit B-like Fe-S oxidoreductase
MTATITIVSKRPTRSARPRNPSTSGGSPLRQSGQASVVRLKMRIVDLDVPLPGAGPRPESVIELLRPGRRWSGRGHAERHRSEQQDPIETGHAKLRLAS